MVRHTPIADGWTFTCLDWHTSGGYLGFGKLDWLPATVPGHVHLDLLHNRVIADPFAGMQELGCQWVDDVDWCYAVEFTAEPSPELPHRRLRFEGLDTSCEIWLNDELVAAHDNMFVPLEVNVDERLQRGINRLEVRLFSARRVGQQRKREYFEREGLAPDVVRFEDRAFVRKAGYMYGWDWGPRLVSAGIWKPVALVEFAARLVDVHVEQEHLPDGDVVLRVTSQTEGVGEVAHFLRLAEDGDWLRIAEGEGFLLKRPPLWWPFGSGAQPLHELRSIMLPLGASSQSLDVCYQTALDSRRSRVGLRTVRLRQDPDKWGTSFQLEVNGRPIWCLGANWIPLHSFPSLATRPAVRDELLRARRMNMNMLRVWGGGLYESDDFYDICDELGILVWQDFTFACSYAPDDAAAMAAVEREAEVQIRRLRNHASLVLWCGNNENLMMFQAKWDDAERHPARCHGERLWDWLLPRVVARLDPHRPYINTSPHSPIPGEPANSDVCGDQHNWDVWHGRGDWTHYRQSRARFASEFGFASAPGPKAWLRALGPSWGKFNPRHPWVRWHDKTKKDDAQFHALVASHYAVSSTLEEWTYHSQLNQRDALRAAIEHYRGSPFCAGTLIWQLNDCWPVQSWSVVDGSGTFKAAAFELARLYAPSLVTFQLVGDDTRRVARFVAVHDNAPHAIDDELTVALRDSVSGEVIREVTARVRLETGQRKPALDVDVSDFDPTRTVVWSRFAGFTACRLLCEPKHFVTASIDWCVTSDGRELVLESSGPALDVWVVPDGADVDTNFISLPTAGVIRLPCRARVDSVKVRWLGGSARVRCEPSAQSVPTGNQFCG